MPIAKPLGDSMVISTVAASGSGNYVHWGVINIGVTNLLIIASMVVVFVLAILLPFPHARDEGDETDRRQP